MIIRMYQKDLLNNIKKNLFMIVQHIVIYGLI